MSKKIPEAIFTAKAINEKLVFDNLEHLRYYCIEHEGEDLFIHIEPMARVPEKMQMYAFWYVNVLECAVVGYTAAGYEGIDKVKADYMLRAEFAKDFIKGPKGYVPIVIDKRDMTKARLLKLLQDAIFFIENDLGITVPSSDEYKVKKSTGKNFKEVK